jgi:hypothetical protein
MSLLDWIQIEDETGEGGALVTLDFWLRCQDRGLLPGWKIYEPCHFPAKQISSAPVTPAGPAGRGRSD